MGTPAQVKAENAARRAKMAGRPKSDLMTSSVTSLAAPDKSSGAAASSSVVGAAGDVALTDEDGSGAASERQITPDIIKGQDSSKSESDDKETEAGEEEVSADVTDQNKANNNNIDKDGSVDREDRPAGTERKIITSEQEAKARIAEKRKEMKEKMEREAEIERLRLEAEAKAEEERRRA